MKLFLGQKVNVFSDLELFQIYFGSDFGYQVVGNTSNCAGREAGFCSWVPLGGYVDSVLTRSKRTADSVALRAWNIVCDGLKNPESEGWREEETHVGTGPSDGPLVP